MFRSLLGQRYDQQLSHLKGRMMDEIIERQVNIESWLLCLSWPMKTELPRAFPICKLAEYMSC
jgi:hypothetical protein